MKKLILFWVIIFSVSVSTQTWIQKFAGISFLSVNKDLQGKIYAGTSSTPKYIFRSADFGNNWDTIFTTSTGNIMCINVDSSGRIYAANQSNGLVFSTNNGVNWTIIPVSEFGSSTVLSVSSGKSGEVFVGTTGGGIWKSTNFGLNFTLAGLAGLNIVSCLVDKTNPNNVYAGSSSTGNNGFYRSTNGGLNWSDNLNARNCYYLMQKPNGNLYIAVTNAPYTNEKSTNSGLNWISQHTFTGAMRGICCDAVGKIYTSGNGGIFVSSNDGLSFTNAGLTFTANQSICSGNKVFVTTTGSSNGGVWVMTDTTITSTGNETKTAQQFVLEQNFPNPFNPSTTISFSIPATAGLNYRTAMKTSQISRLDIYNSLGQLVETLINEQLRSGNYKVIWNAYNYPSGIYYYSLSSGNYTESKKMILLK